MSYAACVKNINDLANTMNLTPEQKLEKLYGYAHEYKEGVCQWYWRGIVRKRRSAFLLLIFVFAMVISATVIQTVVVNYYQNSTREQFLSSQLAFGLFAVSIVLLLVDKVFGWTTGWVRYMKTVLDIEISYNDFTAQWIANNFVNERDFGTCYKNALQLAKEFIQSIDGFQKRETDEWSMQFGDSLNQLGTMLKANQQERNKNTAEPTGKLPKLDSVVLSGAVNIYVTNSSSTKIVKVAIRKGTKVINEKEFNAGCWGVMDISPDIYLVEILDNSKPIISEAVEINSGKVLRVDLTI